MGILMGIFSFAIGFVINLVDGAIELMLGSIGYSMSTFVAVFPFASVVSDVFVALGLAILIGGLIWNGVKGVAAPFGVEYENPLHLIGKVAFTWFAVINLTDIIDIIIRFFQIAMDFVTEVSVGDVGFEDGFALNMATGLISDAAGKPGLLAIVYAIFVVILGWKFIKLLAELVERYIVYCFVCLIGPVFVATAAFKSTRDIAGTWMRAFFGQSFLILLNTITAKMFLSYCEIFMENIAGVNTGEHFIPTISMLFFGFAFLNFAARVDTLLRILGLNTAHTGASLLDAASGGVTRMIAGARGMQTIGSAASHAAKEAKAAGGFGTLSGTRAAMSTFMSDLTGAGKGNRSDAYVGGAGTNRRQDGSKANADAPGRRVGADIPLRSGDLLRQEGSPSGQIVKGQKEIEDALQHKSNPDNSNGIGATSELRGVAAKMDYADGGVLATAGEQNEIADRIHGSGKQMGNIEQSTMTANAARAAATSAERFTTGNGETMPIASYQGAEAAAAMNGVTAFGNDHLQGFNYTTSEDGLSYISGQNFDDGSSVTFDSVEGGIATGVYTDADGNSTAFSMVHDNAVASQHQAVEAGVPGAQDFDVGQSVGRIGDGSGKTGYYVVPMASTDSNGSTVPFGHTQSYQQMGATVDPRNPVQVRNAGDQLRKFVAVSNPVEKTVQTRDGSRIKSIKDNAKGGIPSYGKGKKK